MGELDPEGVVVVPVAAGWVVVVPPVDLGPHRGGRHVEGRSCCVFLAYLQEVVDSRVDSTVPNVNLDVVCGRRCLDRSP